MIKSLFHKGEPAKLSPEDIVRFSEVLDVPGAYDVEVLREDKVMTVRRSPDGVESTVVCRIYTRGGIDDFEDLTEYMFGLGCMYCFGFEYIGNSAGRKLFRIQWH